MSNPGSENSSQETPRIPVTKTELVWPGKYNSDGTLREVRRVSLPFQVIERVNETRATREARKQPQELSLFEVYEGREGETFEEGWRNKLIWGDNLLVMGSLLESFAGKIDLIYIDPPFATGADFSFATEIGESGLGVEKAPSLVEEKAYRDTWSAGVDSYIGMMYDRLRLARDLLADTGTLFVHLDSRVGPLVKLVLDELFGADRLVNEIIWHYGLGAFRREVGFPQKHDTIYFYSKTDNYHFNKLRGEPTEAMLAKYSHVDEEGRRYMISYGKRYYMKGGKPFDDVWEIPTIAATSGERVGYPTQKPEALVERIIEACTSPGNLVADFFVGSGTTSVVAEKLGRRWIACDLSRWGIHVSRKRHLDLEGGRPFEILNLGRYERQYWQQVTFGHDEESGSRALYEYLAFILRLYQAEPVSGMTHLHGTKGGAMVHIGSVDAPVTIDAVMEAVRECAAVAQSELHVLGWEWEMGLYELMVDEAKKRDVKLVCRQIPREVMEQQAVDAGDVEFFELAHLEMRVEVEGRSATVALKDFVMPNTELVPEDVRMQVERWSDYIDYWAVEWDFQDDTFMQGWVAYRTRQERALELVSDPHTYEEAGTYEVVVKVIDIFGNDTSQSYEVEVE